MSEDEQYLREYSIDTSIITFPHGVKVSLIGHGISVEALESTRDRAVAVAVARFKEIVNPRDLKAEQIAELKRRAANTAAIPDAVKSMNTIDDLVAVLKLIDDSDLDTESVHVEADEALLTFIGNEDVSRAFYQIDKWYA